MCVFCNIITFKLKNDISVCVCLWLFVCLIPPPPPPTNNCDDGGCGWMEKKIKVSPQRNVHCHHHHHHRKEWSGK